LPGTDHGCCGWINGAEVVDEQAVHEHEKSEPDGLLVRWCAKQSCMVQLQSVQSGCSTLSIFYKSMEDATMPRAKQASKQKRGAKAVPVLGAAGLTFSLVGGASAAVAPTQDVPPTPNITPGHEFTLGEEEISDVTLATFYVFDKENTGATQSNVQVAYRGCGGCRGCRGCRACRGCRCGVGCGVGGACCASWGGCRWC